MVEIMAKETEKKKAEEAYFITTKELAEAGRDNILGTEFRWCF